MNTQAKYALIAALAMSTASTVFAGERRTHSNDDITPSAVLVRVHKFTGLDAAHRERVLFQSERGVLLPLSHLAVIGNYTNYGEPRVADGTYGDLKVELANEAHIYGSPTGPVHTPLRADGANDVISIPGTVVVSNGEASPLWLASNRDSAYGQADYRYAERGHSRDRDHEDEDDDD